MYCTHCGGQIKIADNFCTSCGGKTESIGTKTYSISKRWHWKSILVTVLTTSLFWFFYYYGFADRSRESANIMGNLIETIGRQKQAWEKSEQVTQLMSVGLSNNCMYTEGCIDKIVEMITTLKAQIDKESAEIDNLWSENIIGRDFDSYFSSLDESSQVKLLDILNIYFPEESKELETTHELL